jgi:methionyl-tRNA formyltransferase
MNEPRILLFGLYELGFRSLEALAARDLRVVGVVTKPESSLELLPLTRLARTLALPLLAPESPRRASFLRDVKELAPDLIAVAGYHRILPPSLLRLPSRGVVNLHGSLLPAYRGPCPWKWALVNGETKTGVTVQRMEAELDRGDLLAQSELRIDPQDTGESLFLKICAVGGPLLARTIEGLHAGTIVPRAQDEKNASYQGYPTDEDARIRWEWTAERIRNLVRGFCPRPGAWTAVGGTRVQIREAVPVEGPLAPVPGMILGSLEGALLVSTGRGNVAIPKFQIDGKVPERGTFFDPAPARRPSVKTT